MLQKRRELRLIVASATMDAKELQAFFNNNRTADKKKDTAVIMSIKGRQFPVDIHYLKGRTNAENKMLVRLSCFYIEPTPCYIQCTVDTVLKINSSKEPGDILAFLTGQEEVDRAVRLLNEHANLIEQKGGKEKMLVLPMYGSLPFHDQLKVFKRTPDGYRKVIIATNIAETSVTIPDIVHGEYFLIPSRKTLNIN